MSLKGKAYIVGVYEHPTRKAPDKSLPWPQAPCSGLASERGHQHPLLRDTLRSPC